MILRRRNLFGDNLKYGELLGTTSSWQMVNAEKFVLSTGVICTELLSWTSSHTSTTSYNPGYAVMTYPGYGHTNICHMRGANGWYQLTFPDLYKVKITEVKSNGSNPVNATPNMRLQTSKDGTTWVDLKTFTWAAAWDITFDKPIKTNYFRIYWDSYNYTEGGSNYGPALSDLWLYGYSNIKYDGELVNSVTR